MTFQSQLDSDMENTFLNTDEFAESIVYTPKGGTAVTIPAVVSREQVEGTDLDQARVLGKEAEIIIQNDATNGVTSIDTKGDSVSLAPLPGDTAVSWDVIEVVESSDAHWKLRITR